MQWLTRKRFVTTLGAAGMGLGLMVGAAVAPVATAQEHPSAGVASQRYLAFKGDKDGADYLVEGLSRSEVEAMQAQAYDDFTRALADELEIDDPDTIDAAIRSAMMATVDANDGLSKETREEQKALIRDAGAPIGPAYRGFGG